MSTTLKPLFRLIEFHGIAVNDLEVTAGGLPPGHGGPLRLLAHFHQHTNAAKLADLAIDRVRVDQRSGLPSITVNSHMEQFSGRDDFKIIADVYELFLICLFRFQKAITRPHAARGIRYQDLQLLHQLELAGPPRLVDP